jgi:hypothetical protein
LGVATNAQAALAVAEQGTNLANQLAVLVMAAHGVLVVRARYQVNGDAVVVAGWEGGRGHGEGQDGKEVGELHFGCACLVAVWLCCPVLCWLMLADAG